jgi:serine/threonine-protein kinase
VPEPAVTASETELRAHVERALTASYELDREMGRGGMGIVYRAKDRRLKRTVAVKVLPPELAFRSEIRSRFLREAETAAQLNHPHIVPIYSVDEHDGIVYFVMACVDGENLGKRIHERGPLPIADVRRILIEVADALSYAHSRGVVHRDIKPDNILLDHEDDRALVTDFGIARAIIEGSDARLTATGMAIGTPAYMSPEQSAGDREIDGRSDLYALGVVAYQMLAGELPFNATSTPAMLVKHLSERPQPIDDRRPDVPLDLAAVVMRLLEKEPSNRFASAAELEATLRGELPALPPSYATARPAAAPRPGFDAPSAPPSMSASRPASPGLHGAYGGGALAPAGMGEGDLFAPTPVELARWEAPAVRDLRKKIGTYAIVNAVIIIVSILTDVDLMFFTAIWTLYLAFKYAKLWSDGYDWRDVFKQPRDRLFFDVVAQTADDASAIFDAEKRARVRERIRQNRLRVTQGAGGVPTPLSPVSPVAPAAGQQPYIGPHADAIREANAARDEIVRLVNTMPKAQREQLPELVPSAAALAEKIQGLASTVAELDRNLAPGAGEVVEEEIARLEAAANPLDRAASEERVKRLAYLKRQRRALVDMMRRRDAASSKLESCRLALQNMRIDLVRLRTGAGSSVGQVTTVAERAMALAREVDAMVYAQDEVASVVSRK